MTTDLNKLAADLEASDYVASANIWQGRRVYVNLANADKSFRGDRNAKIFFEAGEWHIDHGKGVNSRGYDASFNSFHGDYLA